MQRQEDSYLDGVQNEIKNRTKNKYNKSLNREAVSTNTQEKDIFFQKSKKK